VQNDKNRLVFAKQSLRSTLPVETTRTIHVLYSKVFSVCLLGGGAVIAHRLMVTYIFIGYINEITAINYCKSCNQVNCF
jgi:hypothetical protein